MNGVKKQKVNKKQVPISLATAQSLLHLVKGELTYLEVNSQMINEVISETWDASIPTDPNTIEYFNMLNHAKTAKRINSKRIQKLANISKELKAYLKGK